MKGDTYRGKDYSNPITQVCKDLKEEIMSRGEQFETTKELIGQSFEVVLKDLSNGYSIDPVDLRHDIKYNVYGEEKFEKRMEDERFHYMQLRYGLLHKVEELHFFNNTNLENRKTVIFSNDCISSIQYIKRGSMSTLLVHMRSSDVEALLPLDLLALAGMLRAVNDFYQASGKVPFDQEVRYESLKVTIGSAHYYLSGGRDAR